LSITKWKVDPAHSTIEFSVRHMMVAKVKGAFKEFTANIEADPADLTTANIEFNIDVASVDTRNNDRDNHLRSADFFDVEKHPNLTFKSTKITKTGEGEYEVTGDVTIKDTTRSETFNVSYEGHGKDPWGNEVAGFAVEGKVDRTNYGLTWNAALETGGVLVGDQIKISIDIEAQKQS
jgi:polyisoprenoid-binding protein YceI